VHRDLGVPGITARAEWLIKLSGRSHRLSLQGFVVVWKEDIANAKDDTAN
jgi:hypothetical protein